MAFNILVVDDEADIRELVSGILSDNGYETNTAGNYVDAIESINKKRPNLVVLDVWLGDNDRDGLRLLEVIKKDCEHMPVIVISGHGTIETAILAIKKGAYDFIEKPFDSRRLVVSIEKAIETSNLQLENVELKIKAKVPDGIPGKSQNVISIRQTISKIAPLGGRCTIIGPFGSDKETIARDIHKLSPRAQNSFGTLNCRSSGIRQLETELFGTEIKDGNNVLVKPGLLERISGGTLFIDELNVTPHDFQMEILKLIKNDSFQRIGSNEKIKANVRIIAGFTPNITQLIKTGEFSDELYCRLNANTIKILPLKSRKEDIPYLLDYFMEQATKVRKIMPRKFSSEVIGLLNSYPWPGDVMQMQNMIDWILTVSISEDSDKGIITLDDLPKEIFDHKHNNNPRAQFIFTVSELPIREARDVFEREYFIEQLTKFSGNISQTAKFVGMERSALHRKLKSLDIVDSRRFKCDDL